MIASYIGKDIVGEPLAELEKLLSPVIDYDWKQIQFLFLPWQIKDMDKLIKATSTNIEFLGVAPVEQYEKLMDTIFKYQEFKNVKNVGATIHTMIDEANRQMDDAGFEIGEEWVTINRLFGAGAIPKSTADLFKLATEKMKTNHDIGEKDKWRVLDVLINAYLKN